MKRGTCAIDVAQEIGFDHAVEDLGRDIFKATSGKDTSVVDPYIEAPEAFGIYTISAAARRGLDALLAAWWERLLWMKKATVRLDAPLPLP